MSPTTVGLLGLLIKCLGLCPKHHDRENSEVPSDLTWILIYTSQPGLPFHCAALLELLTVGVLCIGPRVESS